MGRSGGNGGERDPLLPVRAPVTVKVKRQFQDEESLWSWSPSPVSRRKQKEKDWTGGECGKKKQEEGEEDEETEEETIGRIGRNAMRKVTLRVIPLIALTVWVSWLDKLNIALAGPGIMKSLNLSAERFAFATSLFFITYPLCMTPSSLIGQRLGPRIGLPLMLFFFGAFSMLTASVTGFGSLIVVRLLLGAAEAGILPFTTYTLSLYYGQERMNFALGQMNALQSFLTLFTGPLGAIILHFSATSPLMQSLAGWQWLLLLEGLPAVVVSGLVALLLPNSPEGCSSFLSPEEHEWFMRETHRFQLKRASRSGNLRKYQQAGIATKIFSLLSDYRVVAVTISMLFSASSFFGYYVFYPTVLSNNGRNSLALISLLDTIPRSLGIIVTLVTSYISDKTGHRIPIAAGGMFIAASGLMTTACAIEWKESFAIQYASISTTSIGGVSVLSTIQSYQSDILPADSAAIGFALINAISAFGGILGPNIFGILRDATGGFVYPMAAMSCLSYLGFFFVMTLQLPCVRRIEEAQDDDSTDAHDPTFTKITKISPPNSPQSTTPDTPSSTTESLDSP